MYSNKRYFIFGFGAGNIWVNMKLEHILGLLKKEKGNLFSVNFFILHGKTINENYDSKYIESYQLLFMAQE